MSVLKVTLVQSAKSTVRLPPPPRSIPRQLNLTIAKGRHRTKLHNKTIIINNSKELFPSKPSRRPASSPPNPSRPHYIHPSVSFTSTSSSSSLLVTQSTSCLAFVVLWHLLGSRLNWLLSRLGLSDQLRRQRFGLISLTFTPHLLSSQRGSSGTEQSFTSLPVSR